MENIKSLPESVNRIASGNCPVLRDYFSINVIYTIFPIQEKGEYYYMKTKQCSCPVKHEDNNCSIPFVECPLFVAAPLKIKAKNILK